MRYAFDFNNDIVSIRLLYTRFQFNICDIETVLKYLQHRQKTSKRFYITLYRNDFARNKLYRELIFPDTFRGACVGRNDIKFLIDDLLEFKNGLETNLELLPMKVVRAIYRNKIGV